MLGACVVIVIVLVEPFTQQIISYYNCDQIRTDLQATLPRSNNYSNEGIHVHAAESELDLSLQGAIYGGLMGLNSSKSLSFSCPSGNCTFANTSWTLGYSSTCYDSTSEVNHYRCDNLTTCRYTWPKANLTLDDGWWTNGTGSIMKSIANGGQSLYFTSWGTNVSMLMFKHDETVSATSCQLWPTLQEFSSNVVSQFC